MPPTPPIASPVLSTAAAWVFFLLLVVWTGVSLYGLSRVVPFFVRWNDSVARMAREGINGERRTRARGLRRQAASDAVILGAYAAVGVVRYLAPPGGVTSTLIAGALVLTAVLRVAEVHLTARDIERIGRVRAAQRSRATDPPSHERRPEARG
jgi:hypothetical protein